MYQNSICIKDYVNVGGTIVPRLVKKRMIAELVLYDTLTSYIKLQSFDNVHIMFKTRGVHPIGAAENGRKRNFVQKHPIFLEFSCESHL